MASLMESILGQLGGDTLEQIGGQLGTDEQKAGAATSSAVAAMLGALSRNAANPEGAAALTGALERDHDGSILDNLGGHLSNPQQANGDGILKHVLGGRRAAVERGLSKSTGIDAASMGKLLTMVAPMVMGALGKQRKQRGLAASEVAGLLGQEREVLHKRQPQAMSSLHGLLDSDGDGDVDMGDIAKHGMGLIGKLFKR